jgi:WD40 repeat protein
MKLKSIFSACLLAFICLISALPSGAQQDCQPPIPPAVSAPQNIFSAQQEMDLGDAVAEHLQSNFHVIDDTELNAHLRAVGARLVARLPETGLRYQFFLFDQPVANAFTLPGGRIYVSRKLVALTRNEDELAGVLAHELGHAVSRQLAIEMTRLLREVLNVTSVTDRRDIFEKYHQLVENSARKSKALARGEGHERKDQSVADQIGLYALALAGYDPQAQSAFWERLTDTKEDAGNWFSNLFGATKPETARLREMLKTLSTLPPACRTARVAASTEEFQQWQAAVISYNGLERKEALRGVVAKRALDPPLRGEITTLRFSPDGKYVLAQDDSGITVLTREPFAVLFRIEAPDAAPAQFTPDSQTVVFYNRALRVERWSVADKKAASVRELFVREQCWETALAPDGKTLACLSGDFDLTLFDVSTGAQVWQKKAFYSFSPNDPFSPFLFELMRVFAALNDEEVTAVQLGFSPDAHYFVAGYNDTALAVDLTTNAPVQLRGPLKKLLGTSFTFVAPDRVLGVNREDIKKSTLVSFPAGEVVAEWPFSSTTMTAVAHGNYVLLRPIRDYPVGVLSLDEKKIIMANKAAALDIYDQWFVSERVNGELGLYKFGQAEPLAKLTLPLSQLGPLRAAALSPDMRWLAVSQRSRGAVWDLTTGARAFHTRGFRGAYFANGLLYADFPKTDTSERTIGVLNPTTRQSVPGAAITEQRAVQYGPFVVLTKPAKQGGGLSQNVDLEVRDVRDSALLWSRNFPKEAPGIWVSATEGTMVLVWPTASEAAKAEIKADASLSQRLAAMREKEGDYFLQVLDARTGQARGKLLIETGKGSFRVANVFASGDWVVVADNENRVLVYSLATGEQVGRVFGSRPVVAQATGLLSVETDRGQLAVYDVATMTKREQYTFTSPISLARFSPDGKQLFVLTANQTIYVLEPAGKS